MSETAPAPLVVYQRTELFIDRDDYDPPETATPELLEELTPLVAEIPVEVEVDVEVDVEPEVDAEGEVAVAAVGVTAAVLGIK